MAESCECCVISSHYIAIERIRQHNCVSSSTKLESDQNAAKSENEANLASTEFIAYLEVLLLDPICTCAHGVITYDHYSVKN